MRNRLGGIAAGDPKENTMQGYENPPKPRNVPLIVCSVAAAGCVFLFILIVAATVLFPVFAQARDKARAVSCLSNEKQQALGVLMYVEDYDETFPRVGKWMDVIAPYIKSERVFHCPSVSQGKITPDCGYAFDSRLSGAELADIESPRDSAMIFESTNLKRSAADACKSLPQEEQVRHQCDNIAYIDGHARGFRRSFIADEITNISKNPITPKTKKAGKKSAH
jgi:hypothetical protein